MKLFLERLFKTSSESTVINDIILALPRILCGIFLAFVFGASKFGMPWSPFDANLSFFQVSDWFVEDVENFGGVFAVFPGFFAWMAAASETIGGLMLIVGFGTRMSSFLIMLTMLVAIFFQKWNDGLWAMLPALGFLWVALHSMVRGSGRIGLDYIIGKRLENNRLLTTPLKNLKVERVLKTTIKIVIVFFTMSCNAKDHIITMTLDTSGLNSVDNVSVRGNVSPLSQSDDYTMTDTDGDGIYEATITFKTNKRNVKFKFVIDGEMELQGSDPRIIWFRDDPLVKKYVFNEYNFYSKAQLKKLTYTGAQIDADIDILEEVLQYVHPNIYKFRDSIALQNDFKTLRLEIKQNPMLPNAYGAISRFASKIKCSHTFTNPWNQGVNIEKALLSQQDKIPFTFNRIGTRIFIDKNASANPKLIKGLELIEINGNTTQDVLFKLSGYISSDGNNYEKKLDRLVVNGEEKYALFDIFYPIEFGSSEQFILKLKNIETQEEFKTQVKATSKTNRTRGLIKRYGKFDITVKEGWNFELLDDKTAKLTLKSFAIQSKAFDWESYLDNVFEKISDSEVLNLIIDIRGNEGGEGEVGKYILERIIDKPMKAKAMESSVRYLKIPKRFEIYMSTWSKFPYDFSKKIQSQKNGRYYLKDRYSIPETTFKPKEGGFKGQIYLLTDASNSSATHLMAMYANQIDNVTIVGQDTGGNQMGTNGGFIFFLRLPNTKVEIDIPVVSQYIPVSDNAVDGGVVPHVNVEKSVSDYMNHIDTELNVVLNLIKTK